MTQLFHIETARALYSIGQDYKHLPGVSDALKLFAPRLGREDLIVHPRFPCTHLVLVIADNIERSEITHFYEKVGMEIVRYLPAELSSANQTILQSLERFKTWLKSGTDNAKFEIEVDGDTFVTYTLNAIEFNHFTHNSRHSLVTELFVIAITCAFLRHISQQKGFVKALYLQHESRASLPSLLAAGDAQVYISQTHTMLALDTEFMQQRVKKTRGTKSTAPRPLQTTTFSEELKLGIRPYIGFGNVTTPEIADVFGIPKRTIQHRLSKEGVSLKEITNSICVELFDLRYEKGRFEIEDLAAHLGYSNASSFIRIYKRVTGRTPGQTH
ncbi:helix-turn-helix domain-containing protein [Vibrio breoganii]|uniref:helix-turn-helix domain-containing protein n=1 Tax=Vibrio breoganii TaxID=553239 RepID=UPI0021C4308F|nr:helix-turn-helix domain-containing protein [Vibrio breoganii]MDN3715755.1 helix-turn-helix domain-containing protein [Vibrio breoganii]